MADKKEFIKKELVSDPKNTGLQVGQTVKWVNDYGVEWEHKIIGFCYTGLMAEKYNKTIYLDNDAYWFPLSIDSIKK